MFSYVIACCLPFSAKTTISIMNSITINVMCFPVCVEVVHFKSLRCEKNNQLAKLIFSQNNISFF